MNCFVLGALRLEFGGRSVTPTARKPRQLLSLLLLNADRTVSVTSLIRGLWDGEPPQSAHITLQTYIVHLRKQIADGLGANIGEAKKILVTTDGGYLLKRPEGYFDLVGYRELSRDGRSLLESGSNEDALHSLQQALMQWRGRALSDVQPTGTLAAEVDRLEESRLRTMEQYLDAALRLGREREHLDELSELCAEHPLNENLHFVYIVALYRCGLRFDALRMFRQHRDQSVEQLGLEPTKRIQRLHAAMLRGEEETLLQLEPANPFGLSSVAVSPLPG
jgi:DNA-binding SARP family transcriptional activator